MSDEELMEFAKRLAAQRIVVENIGMMNQPSDLKDRVSLDARYMIARDKLSSLEMEYQTALRKFVDGTQDGTRPSVHAGQNDAK